VQRLQRSLQVCGRVGVGTDNRDFGEGNFAEIANAGAFLQANVHEDASGAHRPDCEFPGCLHAHRIHDQFKTVFKIDGFLSGIEDVATACAESGFAAQGIGVAEQDFRTTVRAQD
tara:strand:+ start:400 stop:744 length:345 start_codon:yes stop_codon:yes gene_type:complete